MLHICIRANLIKYEMSYKHITLTEFIDPLQTYFCQPIKRITTKQMAIIQIQIVLIKKVLIVV